LAVTVQNTLEKLQGYLRFVSGTHAASAPVSISTATPSPPLLVALLTEIDLTPLRETQAYNLALRAAGAHTVEFYIQSGVPSMYERRKQVEQSMPVLFKAMVNAMTSDNLVRECATLVNDTNRYVWPPANQAYTTSQDKVIVEDDRIRQRLETVRAKAVHALENAAAISGGGSVITASVVVFGVLSLFGGPLPK
jgi:hypothetical protein